MPQGFFFFVRAYDHYFMNQARLRFYEDLFRINLLYGEKSLHSYVCNAVNVCLIFLNETKDGEKHGQMRRLIDRKARRQTEKRTNMRTETEEHKTYRKTETGKIGRVENL